jgi:hypothetical protein
MFYDLFSNHSFHYLTDDRFQVYWPIVACYSFLSFFKDGANLSFLPAFGNFFVKLLNVLDNWTEALDNDSSIDAVYMDYTIK